MPTSTVMALDPHEIAERAYKLYCQRGYENGHDVEDWLTAETELRHELSRQSVQEPSSKPRPKLSHATRNATRL